MGKGTEYLLLNQDTPLLTFTCTRNDFDEPEFTENRWLSPLRPIGYGDLTGFLEKRKAPKHRRHIQSLLAKYGCDDLEGFLSVTHALSLNDTFWVKEAGSSLSWGQVSLYENPFDPLIQEAAFGGESSGGALSSTSPEFSTDGFYAKCWVREGDEIFLYKTGSDLFQIEPLSEYLAGQLAELLCPNHVSYDMGFYHGKLVSKCRLFTSETRGLAKASSLFPRETTIPALLDYFTDLGSGEDFRRMCVLDGLIYNNDRHYGNFGVLFDTATLEPLQMAPVFDHNKSLFPELDQRELEHPDWYLTQCKPRLGKDFCLTAKGLLTPEIRLDLKNLLGFRFRQHPGISAPQKRLDALSDLVNRQIKGILEG